MDPRVLIMVRATRVTPKLEEYITPVQVFMYTRKMNSPKVKARVRARAMSRMDTPVTFSRKLDLKMSWKVIKTIPFYIVSAVDTAGGILGEGRRPAAR